MEIKNENHRTFIEETGDFTLADSLNLRYCGACAVPGILTLVSYDAPSKQFHEYAGTSRCLELPVCPGCIEAMGSYFRAASPDMYGCPDLGCQFLVEERRAARALSKEPLFYAYEAYPSAYSSEVTVDGDVRRGPALRPAGDILAFTAEDERDRWVNEGPTLIRNQLGYVVNYRSRTVVSSEQGRRLHVPDDEDPGYME